MRHRGPPRLADRTVVERIKKACNANKVYLSRKTTDYLVARGIRSKAVIAAIVDHIVSNYRIYVKPYPTGGQGYHGSICLDPIDTSTVYFEIKFTDAPVGAVTDSIWVQIHDHDTGYAPLAR